MRYGLLYLSISSSLFLISGYIINIWLGRYLGPMSYGVYGIVISLMSIINLVQTTGLPQSLSKYLAENEEKFEEILKSGLILQIVSTFIITIFYFIFSGLIASILKDSSLTPYLQLSAFIFPFYGIYSIYTGYYNGLHNFKRQAVIGIIYSVAKTFFVISLALIFGIKGAISGFIIAPLFAILTGLKLPKLSASIFPYKKLILFSLPILGFAFLATLLQSMDLYFIKALLASDADPGYYTANQNISRIPYFALSAFALVLFPSISRGAAEKNIIKIRSLIHKSLRIILILLIPGTLLISVTSAQIINLLYSKVYLPAAPSLSVLIFGIGFLTVFTVLANILNGAGEPKKSLWIAGLGVVITAFSCLFMVPKYGLVGAALSTTLGSFVAMVIATYFVYKRFQALVPIKSVIKILFSSFVIYFMAKMITIPILLLPILYVFLFAVYIGILIILKEITFEDWKQVKSLIPSWVPFVNNV